MNTPTIKTQIMDFVESKGFVTRSQIVKFYVESIKGLTLDRKLHRNVLTIALAEPKFIDDTRSYLRKPSKFEPRYLAKNLHHEYYVTTSPFSI